jgi:hypothetical protein
VHLLLVVVVVVVVVTASTTAGCVVSAVSAVAQQYQSAVGALMELLARLHSLPTGDRLQS